MNIVICLKGMLDTAEVNIDSQLGVLRRRSDTFLVTSHKESVLEKALELKREMGAKVTVICLGNRHGEKVLEEAIAMGVDEGILISDKSLIEDGMDSILKVLISKVRRLDYDLLLVSKQVLEETHEEFGIEIAKHLNPSKAIF